MNYNLDELKIRMEMYKFYAFRTCSGYGKDGCYMTFQEYSKNKYGITNINLTYDTFPMEMILEFDCAEKMSMFIMKWC